MKKRIDGLERRYARDFIIYKSIVYGVPAIALAWGLYGVFA